MKKLVKILKNMYLTGSDDNFLTISKDPYYIQVNGAKKAPKIFIDAVSNSHLAEEEFLSEEQLQKFAELGFETEPRSGNLSLEMDFSDVKAPEIDEKIIKALDIYGIDPHKADFDENID